MEALRKELCNVKALMLETPITTPVNKIKIIVSKPSPLNVNSEPVIVT